LRCILWDCCTSSDGWSHFPLLLQDPHPHP
jgi:hypothetical protein